MRDFIYIFIKLCLVGIFIMALIYFAQMVGMTSLILSAGSLGAGRTVSIAGSIIIVAALLGAVVVGSVLIKKHKWRSERMKSRKAVKVILSVAIFLAFVGFGLHGYLNAILG